MPTLEAIERFRDVLTPLGTRDIVALSPEETTPPAGEETPSPELFEEMEEALPLPGLEASEGLPAEEFLKTLESKPAQLPQEEPPPPPPQGEEQSSFGEIEEEELEGIGALELGEDQPSFGEIEEEELEGIGALELGEEQPSFGEIEEEELEGIEALELGEDQPSFGEIEEEELEGIEALELGEEFLLPHEEEEDTLEETSPSLLSSEKMPTPSTPSQASIVTNEEWDAIEATLNTLPFSLRLQVEEIFGIQDHLEASLVPLLRLLITGASVSEIASSVSDLTGETIELPPKIRKGRGVDLLAKRERFAYQFSRRLWPKLRWYLLGFLLLWALSMGGFSYVYRPINASLLYRKGLRAVMDDRFDEGNRLFEEAFLGTQGEGWSLRGWPSLKWMLRYAEAFQERKNFEEAEVKYIQMVGKILQGRDQKRFQDTSGAFPHEPEGYLAYAKMLSEQEGDYAAADAVLHALLLIDPDSREGLLAAGDNMMQWGLFDEAYRGQERRFYTRLIAKYGTQDSVLFRLLRSFALTGHDKEVASLSTILMSRMIVRATPSLQSSTYTEVGAYWIRTGRLTEARDILYKALALDDSLPDLHYTLAHYYRKTNAPREAELALRKALFLFSQSSPPQEMASLRRHIDSHRLWGERLSASGHIRGAGEAFTRGLALYKESMARHQIDSFVEIGKLASDLGGLFYDYKALTPALHHYLSAEKHAFLPPENAYRMGHIHYTQGDLRKAEERFFHTKERLPGNNDVLYALANTLVKRSNYPGAEGSYRDLVARLSQREAMLAPLFPGENLEHRQLIERLLYAHNNLGVTLFQEFQSSDDAEKFSEALFHFTRAIEYNDKLTRTTEGIRSRAPTLPFLNQKSLLAPSEEDEDSPPSLYGQLPRKLFVPDRPPNGGKE